MKTWSELQARITATDLLLVYYSTPACQVCKVLRPKVEFLIDELPNWEFQYVDLSEAQEIQGQGLIFAVPTLVLYASGTEVKRFSRNLAMSELEEALDRYGEMFSGS